MSNATNSEGAATIAALMVENALEAGNVGAAPVESGDGSWAVVFWCGRDVRLSPLDCVALSERVNNCKALDKRWDGSSVDLCVSEFIADMDGGL